MRSERSAALKTGSQSDTSITKTTHEVICVYSTHQSSPSAQPYKSARPQELQCFDVVSEAFVYWLSLMWSSLWVLKKNAYSVDLASSIFIIWKLSQNYLIVCGECYKIYICHKSQKNKTCLRFRIYIFKFSCNAFQLLVLIPCSCFQSGPRWLCVWCIKGRIKIY